MRPKTKVLLAFVATSSWLLPAGWLFASGNLPGFYCENEAAVNAVNRAWPRLATATFSTSRKICRDLRRKGIPVPPTYNERIITIACIRRQVNQFCDVILKDFRKEARQ